MDTKTGALRCSVQRRFRLCLSRINSYILEQNPRGLLAAAASGPEILCDNCLASIRQSKMRTIGLKALTSACMVDVQLSIQPTYIEI